MSQFEQPRTDIPVPPRRAFRLEDFEPNAIFSELDTADLIQFLEKLADGGSSMLAAQSMGRSEIEFEAVRAKNPAFASAWAYARKVSVERLDAEARRRAVNGILKDIWYKGEAVGTVTEYSDSLLAILLKAHHPSYGAVDINAGSSGGPVTININSIPSGKYVDESEDPVA